VNYYQDTDYRLAGNLLSRLDIRTVLDVGAEKGGFVDVCLAAHAERVMAFEPYPPHVEHLRRRFAGSSVVTVFDFAIAEQDGCAILNVAHDRAGHALDYHHSLVQFSPTDDVEATSRWSNTAETPVTPATRPIRFPT
jgi:FkbM family methyltransferase